MGGFLIHAYRTSGTEWFRMHTMEQGFIRQHCPNTRAGDAPKLRHWELIERAPKEHRGSRGYYRVTQLGIDFINGTVQVPKSYLEYNNGVWGWADEFITIRQALKDKFDFWELMRA
jgi:hypothetical protein